MKTFFLFSIFFFSFLSCSKNSEIGKDSELPVVNLVTPLNNETFSNGQTVTISGSITDNKFIAEIHIVVTDLNTGAIYVHVHIYPSATTADFTQDFTASAGIQYKVEIIAVDRSMNQGVESVEISCN